MAPVSELRCGSACNSTRESRNSAAMPSPLPMFGSARARILQVMPVSIHGDIYYDVAVVLGESNDQPPVSVRLANHLCQRPPKPAETVELTFLMQQVTGVRFV